MREHQPVEPVADSGAVITGDHYRITVLTAGLLRLEYAADGGFEDRASTFAVRRRLPVPEFTVHDDDGWLVVETERVRLTYDRGAFTPSGLFAEVPGNVSNYQSVWRFGERLRTLGGTARTLDGADGRIDLEDGVVSRWGFSVVDDSRSPVFDADGRLRGRTGPSHDLYLFASGLDHRAAVRDLYAVSGPPPVLPRWALGNWWSRYHPYSDAEYQALIERFATERLPFSVAVLDMDWHRVDDVPPEYGSGWTGYSWNRRLFPDPPAFLGWLHEHGLRVTLNVHPADGVRAFEDAYGPMCAALGRTADGRPVPFDVTDPEFMDAYFDVLHRGLEEQGVDFWWIDWQQGPYSREPGLDPLWVLNAEHFADSGRDGRRPMTFSRYAGPGSHRYPIGFSGDTVASWDSLAFQPEFTATAANIGYGWWSHDIGGHYEGIHDDEMVTRWVQFGVFSPILRLHSTLNPFTSKEPWRFTTEYAGVIADQLRLRHRLVPYLHTMNHRAAREGEPLVRPMYWSHPGEDEAYEVPHQYWFGTELIVAAITTPIDPVSRLGAAPAWLPPGTWVDLFTEVVYDGGGPRLLHRDLTSIPVLAAAGAIVPMTRDGVAPAQAAPDQIDLHVVVGADGAFDLVEDDGSGDGLDPAAVVVTPIRYDAAAGTVTIGPATGAVDLLPASRTWTVHLPATGRGAIEVSAAATERVVVDLEPGCSPRTQDVSARIFAVLDRARLPIADKTRAWQVVSADGSRAARFANLTALGLHRPVESAVVELWVPDDRAG